MERRLLRYITTPAMLASWVLGLILAFSGLIDWSQDGWFHAKLILVVLLSAYHGAARHVDQGLCLGSEHGGRRVSTVSPTRSRRC